MRGTDYVIDFIQSENKGSYCVPVAFECSSFMSFQGGHCSDCGDDGSRCAIMNHDGAEYFVKHRNITLDRTPLKMYFLTAPREPFCLYQYNVAVKIHRHESHKLPKPVVGYLKITVTLADGSKQQFELNNLQ